MADADAEVGIVAECAVSSEPAALVQPCFKQHADAVLNDGLAERYFASYINQQYVQLWWPVEGYYGSVKHNKNRQLTVSYKAGLDESNAIEIAKELVQCFARGWSKAEVLNRREELRQLILAG